jgi:MYXO-CTERM domain-containing protein
MNKLLIVLGTTCLINIAGPALAQTTPPATTTPDATANNTVQADGNDGFDLGWLGLLGLIGLAGLRGRRHADRTTSVRP